MTVEDCYNLTPEQWQKVLRRYQWKRPDFSFPLRVRLDQCRRGEKVKVNRSAILNDLAAGMKAYEVAKLHRCSASMVSRIANGLR